MAGLPHRARVVALVAIAILATQACDSGSPAASTAAVATPNLTATPITGPATPRPTTAPTSSPAPIVPGTAFGANCPDLVAFWPGEGNADDVIGGHDGEIMGGVAFEKGMVGQAFRFNATDAYIRVPSSKALTPAGSFTWMAWFRATSLGGAMFGTWGTNGEWANQRSYRIETVPTINTFRFAITDKAHQSDDAFQDFRGELGGAFIGPHWNLGAFVYDASTGTRRIYRLGIGIDGGPDEAVPDGERVDPIAITLATSRADLSIGALLPSPRAASEFFGGLMDEIQLYDRALTIDEVDAAIKAGGHGVCR